VGLRIIFTAIVASLLNVPFLKLIGGVLLLWIAIKLLLDETEETDVPASFNLWGAVRTIAIADMVMSLDNVLAIAAAAHGSMGLIIFGLLLSVPLIVFGATMMITLLQRFPIFVWGGAALLGWVAGELLLSDPAWPRFTAWTPDHAWGYVASAIGAVFVVCVGWLARKAQGRDI
jgi:YjbE family integral membrane protein